MGNLLSSRALRRGTSLAVVACALLAPIAQRAVADSPASPQFGPVIEDFSRYEGQQKCKPKPKKGTLAFSELLRTTYPDTTWIGISRACNIGGTSEHKEGRALDWSRDATDRTERRSVREMLNWLFASDKHGNENAMVRRLGIMYIIWNRRIWSTWDQGWDVYCVQKKRVCKDPDSKSVVHPHTDHVHISLGWAGAKMKTSYWDPALSFEGPPPPGVEPSPSPTPSPSASPPGPD